MRWQHTVLIASLNLVGPAVEATEPLYPGGRSPVSSDAPDRDRQAAARVRPLLEPELAVRGVAWGNRVYLRVFKESRELELWMEAKRGEPWKLVRNYRIASVSGRLGPKTREGDLQGPEGCYEVGRRALNPESSFHLSFNLGYPNAVERARGWTGSALMVHGKAVSIGCYAMTDDSIEQIYSLVSAALQRGQGAVEVHCFPFRMTDERLAAASGRDAEVPWVDFWNELRPFHDRFEASRLPPVVRKQGGHYLVP